MLCRMRITSGWSSDIFGEQRSKLALLSGQTAFAQGMSADCEQVVRESPIQQKCPAAPGNAEWQHRAAYLIRKYI